MDIIAEWKTIPRRVEAAIAGATDASLDEPIGPEELGLTRRQLVHHLAEANLVAASIVIAALGSPGCTYDWSWMMPFGAWLERLDYAHKPIEPALRLLEVLNALRQDAELRSQALPARVEDLLLPADDGCNFRIGLPRREFRGKLDCIQPVPLRLQASLQGE